MTDILVPIHGLPSPHPALEAQSRNGIHIRRALMPEASAIRSWVGEHFARQGWLDELAGALAQTPCRCVIAVRGTSELVGFLCFDVGFRGFLGPGGVARAYRRQGIFFALIVQSCLHLREQGFAYAVAGDVADETRELITRKLEGLAIPGSTPGPYRDMMPKGGPAPAGKP